MNRETDIEKTDAQIGLYREFYFADLKCWSSRRVHVRSRVRSSSGVLAVIFVIVPPSRLRVALYVL